MTFMNKELNKNFTLDDLKIVVKDCICSTRNDKSTYVIYNEPIIILDGNFYIEFKFYDKKLIEFNLQSVDYDYEQAHIYHCSWLEDNCKKENFIREDNNKYKNNDIELYADRSLKGGNPQILCKVL